MKEDELSDVDRLVFLMEEIESKKGKTDNDGDITFVHSATGNRNFDVLEKGIISITPIVGMMIMFPSYLLHTVYPFMGEEERRCIAFNGTYRILSDNPHDRDWET